MAVGGSLFIQVLIIFALYGIALSQIVSGHTLRVLWTHNSCSKNRWQPLVVDPLLNFMLLSDPIQGFGCDLQNPMELSSSDYISPSHLVWQGR